MAKEKSLPKTIYVKRDHDRNNPDDTYLVAEKDFKDLAEIGSAQNIGVYELVSMADIITTPNLRPQR